jgi:hypothetical protein
MTAAVSDGDTGVPRPGHVLDRGDGEFIERPRDLGWGAALNIADQGGKSHMDVVA